MVACSYCIRKLTDHVVLNVGKDRLIFCNEDCHKKFELEISRIIERVSDGHNSCECTGSYIIYQLRSSAVEPIFINNQKTFNCKYFAEAFSIYLCNKDVLSNYYVLKDNHHNDRSQIERVMAINGTSHLNRKVNALQRDISEMKESILNFKNETDEIKSMLRDFMSLLASSKTN